MRQNHQTQSVLSSSRIPGTGSDAPSPLVQYPARPER